LRKSDIFVISDDRRCRVLFLNPTTGFLPSLSDIRDGLFKLILYSNLSTLELQGKSVPFITRLKLTGRGVESILNLPCSDEIFLILTLFVVWALGMLVQVSDLNPG
jgi:hypothetical protein